MDHFWTTLRMRIGRLRVRWRRFAATPRGRRTTWVLRQLITLAVVGYLVYRMSLIGWGEIWQALPRTPWFYVIFLGIYFCLPVAHAVTFGIIWERSPLQLLTATLKKRVYDKDVLGHSGDVYMYVWGRTHTGHDDMTLIHHVKDNAIMSSVASTLVAGTILAVFLGTGYITLPDFMVRHSALYVGGGLVLLAGLGWAAVSFRQVVFRLAGRTLVILFGVHLARVVLIEGLQVLEWKVAVPDIALEVWFTFLAVKIIMARIPLLPSQELVFMAAGIELAAAVNVPRAAIAGLLGVHSVLDKGLNLLVFAGTSIWDRQQAARASGVGAKLPSRAPESDGEAERAGEPAASAPSEVSSPS
ncbi:MAG: hypothetical protein R6T83_06775 [Salinibacter sp.]